jgi:hypothetical protein
MMRLRFALLTATALLASLASAADAPAPSRVLIEIYRIAPGQMYVHQDGGNWDFLLIQPASPPPDKAAALDAAWKKLGLPSGARFFVEFRKNIAEHTDTFAEGPTTAADWLKKLDQ